MSCHPENDQTVRKPINTVKQVQRLEDAERIRQEFVQSKKLPLPPHLRPPGEDGGTGEL